MRSYNRDGTEKAARRENLADFVADPASTSGADLLASFIELRDALVVAGVMKPEPMSIEAVYPDATTGVAYSYTPTINGEFAPPLTFSIASGAIPAGAGWSFSTTTGELACASPATEETATFTVQVVDSSSPPQVVVSAAQEVDVSSGATTLVFGNDATPGAGEGFPGALDRALYSIFTKSDAGPVTSINCHFRAATTGGNFKVLAYAVAGGLPTTLLWATASTPAPSGGGWVSCALPGDISGTNPAGTYALAVVVDNFLAEPGKRNDTGTTYRDEGISFASPPNPYGDASPDSTYVGDMAIYCEYLG